LLEVALEEQIRKFIVETFRQGKGELGSEEPLFDSGIIDSMGFLVLLSFIEKNFAVSVDMSEVTMENFSSIAKIVEFINKKSKKEA
jgi:acyl carrier protein